MIILITYVKSAGELLVIQVRKPVKCWFVQKRNFIFSFLAFFIPVVVRCIPMFLAWPYPIGFDTIRYITMIQHRQVLSLGIIGFFKGTNLFYAVAALPYALTSNAVLVVNVLGPLLLGILCFTMYLYARKSLGWSGWKSLLVSLLVSIYFVSLRDSWDLYRQTLGIIFLVITLISLKTFRSPHRYYIASAFMVLTVLSHELAAVILFFIISLLALEFLVKKSFKDFGYLFFATILPIGLFLFGLYSPQTGAITIPSNIVASQPSFGLALYMGGLLVYCYGIIAPFIILGLLRLKDSALRYWGLFCLLIVFLEMLNPSLPLYLWYRWILILVYPLLFFTVQGVDVLWQSILRIKGKFRRLGPKIFVGVYIFLILTLSGYYLTTSPDNSFSYFSEYNSYLSSIPSSMIQNPIPIQDNPSMVNCFNWLSCNTAKDSAVIEHYALYDSTTIYLRNHSLFSITEESSYTWSLSWSNSQNVTSMTQRMVQVANETLAIGSAKSVYTVWWINGQGWYGIPSLPAEFKVVFQSGNMAVTCFPQVIERIMCSLGKREDH